MGNLKKLGNALLVAKPWKGGLGHYFFAALQGYAANVKWLHTYPDNFREMLAFRANKKKWRERLVETISSSHYDIAIFINTLEEFSRLAYSDKHVIWITDDPRPILDGLNPFGKVYLSDPGYQEDVAPRLREGQYAGILPFAHLPRLHSPSKENKPREGVCFIGNRDPKRDAYLKALITHNVPLKIYGNYFLQDPLFWACPRSFRPSMANSKMGRIYSRFSVSLNIHAKVVRGGTNMRTFECAGYGIPQLVESRPGLSRYFEPDREIVTFHSTDEMVEKASALLKTPNGLKKMAARARDRALAEHTYQHRIEKLIEEI